MEKQPNPQAIATSQTMTLSQPLVKSVMLESVRQADLTRYTAKTGMRMIFAVRLRRDEIESQLDTLRRSYRFFSTMDDCADRERALSDITKVAEWYKGQLKLIPDYKNVRTMREKNLQLLEAWVIKLIALLAGSVNVGKNIRPEQTEDIAISIIAKYGDLTLEDVALCFVRVKDGGYGELFDVLDGPKLLHFLAEYEKEVKGLKQAIIDRSDEAAEFSGKLVRIAESHAPGEQNFREEAPAKISQLIPINLDKTEIAL